MNINKCFGLFVIICWSFILYIVFITSIPYNPVTLNKNLAFKVKMLLPEGWNFFTRNPRERRTYIYQVLKNGSVKSLETWPNNNLINFLGVKRTARAIGTDYGIILSNIPDSVWIKSSVDDLNIKTSKRRNLSENYIITRYPDAKKHFLFGEFIFVKREILPWSWYRNNLIANLPLKYVYVSIKNH